MLPRRLIVKVALLVLAAKQYSELRESQTLPSSTRHPRLKGRQATSVDGSGTDTETNKNAAQFKLMVRPRNKILS